MTRSRSDVPPIARMLRLYRQVEDRTLEDLAGAIGISAPTLLRIEQGRSTTAATWLRVQCWLAGAPME